MTEADKQRIEDAEDAEDLASARRATQEGCFVALEDIEKELGI